MPPPDQNDDRQAENPYKAIIQFRLGQLFFATSLFSAGAFFFGSAITARESGICGTYGLVHSLTPFICFGACLGAGVGSLNDCPIRGAAFGAAVIVALRWLGVI